MNELWNALAAQVLAHLVTIEECFGGAVAALGISGIFAIPEKFPRLDIDIWWTWFRDTLQGAVPMKFHKTSPPPQAPTVFQVPANAGLPTQVLVEHSIPPAEPAKEN